MVILCLAASCPSHFTFSLVTLCKMYFPATFAITFSLPVFTLKSPSNIRMSYLRAFHILDLIDHKTHLLLCQCYLRLVHMLI